jgi:6-phosphofructokinase 1
MNEKSNKSDSALLEALRSQPEIQGTGWEILFDQDGRLVDATVDELPGEPAHAHPMAAFYKEFANRTDGREEDFFMPYNAAVPIASEAGIAEAFSRANVKDRIPNFRLLGARRKYRLDPKRLVIGILTAGGNAPGVNTVIDSIVKRHSLLATKAGARTNHDGSIEGLSFLGYLGGYTGLRNGNATELRVTQTDKKSLTAGSMLGTERGEMPQARAAAKSIPVVAAQKEILQELAASVRRDQLDVLYVIGGDGTITAADGMCEALQETVGKAGKPVRVLAAPKTMDNDVNFTDLTFGFRTCVENAVQCIKTIHVEAETCRRLAVLELFGGQSGFVALHASYASGEVDYVLIPEMMGNSENSSSQELDCAAHQLAYRYRKNGHALLVVAEGATTTASLEHGNPSLKQSAFAAFMARLEIWLQKLFPPPALPPAILTSQPKHLIRGTAPNSADIDLCKQTGKLIVDAALSGFGRCVLCRWRGSFVAVPMALCTAHLKRVDIRSYYFLSMWEKYLLASGQGTLSSQPESYSDVEFDHLF